MPRPEGRGAFHPTLTKKTMNEMKSRRKTILLLLTTMICLGAEPSRGSVLGDVASSMPAGTWAELKTNGMNEVFLQYPGGNRHVSTEYIGKATWDSETKQVLFSGAGHFNSPILHRYSETSNTWTKGAQPPSGSHAYYHNAIATDRGLLGFVVIGPQTIHLFQYNIAENTWVEKASTGNDGNIAHALVYFPERGKWYVADGTYGHIREYDDATDTWTTVATEIRCFAQPGEPQGGYYHNFAEYSPASHEIVYGGGNINHLSRSSCTMNASGVITILPPAPVGLSINENGSTITVDPVTGDLLVLSQHGQFYAFNFTSNVWSLIPNHPTMPAVMHEANHNVSTGFVVPIDTYGVIMYMDYKRPVSGIYLYKHAQSNGVPPVPPPPVETTPPSAPTQLTFVTPGTISPPPPIDGVTFEVICQQSTTIFCQDFDVLPPNTAGLAEGIFSNVASCDALINRPDAFCPEIDNGALKFTIPTNSGAGGSGQYYIRFADHNGGQSIGPGQEVFIQWKQKFSASFLNTVFEGPGGSRAPGWKQGMVGAADEFSCSSNELVVQNGWVRGVPGMYHACSGPNAFAGFATKIGQNDFDYQPGGTGSPGGLCLRTDLEKFRVGTGPMSPGCFPYYPDEWLTYQIGITHAAAGEKSRIRLWVSREGRLSVLVIDYLVTLVNTKGYGKFWMMPYHTNKNKLQVHPEGYIWYDQLIISRTQLPDR